MFSYFSSQMALGLMVGAAAFFAVGFFAAGTGKDLPDAAAAADKQAAAAVAAAAAAVAAYKQLGAAAKQEMDAVETAKQNKEYDYSWAMQGVNRSRIR